MERNKENNVRGIASGGPGGPIPPPPPHFNFQTKQGPTVSVSNIRDTGILLFMGVQKLYRSEISQFLPYMLQFLDKLGQHFIFSNYIGEIDTLDRTF